MAIVYNTSTVKDGLSHLYDFKNIKSYPGSGSTVVDMRGSTNLTIAGSPSYNSNGYVTFATNQTTQYVYNASFPMPTDDHSVVVAFRVEDFTQPTQTFFTYQAAGNTNYLLTLFEGSTNLRIYRGGYVDYTVADVANGWLVFTRTRVKTTGVENYYINDSLVGSRTVDVDVSTASNGYLILGQEADAIGGSFDSAQNLDGSLSFFAVYSKELSAPEVKQNFEALRGRYGI